MDSLSTFRNEAILLKIFSDVLECLIAFCVEFKGAANDGRGLFVHDNSFCPRIIKITNWSKRGIFTAPYFLAQPSFRIFGKRIHIIFALPEGNVEHKFPLRSCFKPKCGKFQHCQVPAVQEINYLAAINRIARQSVGVPSQNSVGLASFYALHHFIKNRSAWNFG
ncbi:MAG TPA: hypothetical protein PLK76_02015 [bacterium]|nr:hypothetical protein [bacterium]